MFITKNTATLAACCLLLITTLTSTSALAIGIPGSDISPSGIPSFTHNVTVRANNGKWTVSAHDGFILQTPGGTWSGTGLYTLNATFDGAGEFVSGDLTIRGKIPDLGIKQSTLVTADLNAFDFDALYDPTLIGFGTTNIVCTWTTSCTSNESIWIQLFSNYGGDANARFRTSGIATTTVPVPAAVWLFGTGLAFLGATARRKRARTQL